MRFQSEAHVLYGSEQLFFVKFYGVLQFCFICYIFAAQLPIVPIKDPLIFYGVYMNLDISFNCYLMSVLTLNIFLLRKYRLIIEFCRYFIIFFSTSGAVSVKTGRNQLLVGHKIILLTV